MSGPRFQGAAVGLAALAISAAVAGAATATE
jgi:hypothetical protein